MNQTIDTAVIKTIAYADVFDYPLKEYELWHWLIGQKIDGIFFKKELKNVIKKSKEIKKIHGLYLLNQKEKIVILRKKREKYSAEKKEKAKKIAKLLKCIPTIKFIGITGAVAMNNADFDDDIDMYIITKENALWTTRLLTHCILDIMSARRKPNDIKVTNKVCLNMFVDETHIQIPKDERDVYTAHEVLQMKPIYQKEDIYNKFLLENRWVSKFLPNAYPLESRSKKAKIESKRGETIFEKLAKKIQLSYMKKKRTTEVIKKGILRFHPHDARVYVLTEWKKRLQHAS